MPHHPKRWHLSPWRCGYFSFAVIYADKRHTPSSSPSSIPEALITRAITSRIVITFTYHDIVHTVQPHRLRFLNHGHVYPINITVKL